MYSKERSNIRLNQTRETLIPTVAILILALVPIALSVCPDANDIKPCTCDDEGLQCLRLNNSGLARVFRAPAERKAIRRVWIFQTNLTALKSDSFGEYIIRDLYLDLNQIEQVETGAFGEATKTLQSLSLARNQISKFPFGDLRQMRKLKQLGLGHNKLTVLESSTFPPSDTLESIDLSHNEISNIQPYAFSELYGVSLIDLSRNVLKEVESNSLYVRSTSRNLMVSLRGNKIDKIAVDAFGDNHPHGLDLSKNNLTYLDELVFSPLLLNNTVIDVDENPFSCNDCDLFRWLIELEREYSLNIINFACTDDTKLEDLTLDMIGCLPASEESTESPDDADE